MLPVLSVVQMLSPARAYFRTVPGVLDGAEETLRCLPEARRVVDIRCLREDRAMCARREGGTIKRVIWHRRARRIDDYCQKLSRRA